MCAQCHTLESKYVMLRKLTLRYRSYIAPQYRRHRLSTQIVGRWTSGIRSRCFDDFQLCARLKVEKVKRYSSPCTHMYLKATGRYLPWYGITILPAPGTGERAPPNPAARKTGTRFTYPKGMGIWVDLGGWLHSGNGMPTRRRSPIQPLTGPDVDRDQRVTAKPGHHRTAEWRFNLLTTLSGSGCVW